MNCKVFLFVAFLSVSLFAASPIQAAKKFVAKKTVKRTGGFSLPSLVSYRGDKRALFLSFRNFNGLDSVSYSFTYETNGNPQGAGGTITASNNPTAQRELLFGTCSTSVCTYHYNLRNARLVLTAKLTNGTTMSKAYRIKTYQ